MPLSEKTLAEMRAGAVALANHHGVRVDARTLDVEEIMKNAKTVRERAEALERWQSQGLLEVEKVNGPDCEGGKLVHKIIHRVKNGPAFEETPIALMFGGYPSERLTADIALAIMAVANREPTDG